MQNIIIVWCVQPFLIINWALEFYSCVIYFLQCHLICCKLLLNNTDTFIILGSDFIPAAILLFEYAGYNKWNKEYSYLSDCLFAPEMGTHWNIYIMTKRTVFPWMTRTITSEFVTFIRSALKNCAQVTNVDNTETVEL